MPYLYCYFVQCESTARFIYNIFECGFHDVYCQRCTVQASQKTSQETKYKKNYHSLVLHRFRDQFVIFQKIITFSSTLSLLFTVINFHVSTIERNVKTNCSLRGILSEILHTLSRFYLVKMFVQRPFGMEIKNNINQSIMLLLHLNLK